MQITKSRCLATALTFSPLFIAPALVSDDPHSQPSRRSSPAGNRGLSQNRYNLISQPDSLPALFSIRGGLSIGFSISYADDRLGPQIAFFSTVS
jgi:hypothetical protein